jgi:hypothetical protein
MCERETLIALTMCHCSIITSDACPKSNNGKCTILDCATCLADHLIANGVVPVVRCKDCKHGEFEQENRMWACVRCADYDEDFDMFTGFIEYHNEDHFCSYGEKGEDTNVLTNADRIRAKDGGNDA